MTSPIELGKFVGAPAHTQYFEGVAVAESTYAAGLSVPSHAHDAPLVSLVLEGAATEEVGRRSRELGAHQLLYTPSFVVHGHRFLTPGRWLNIQFSDPWFTRVGGGERPLPTAPLIVRDGSPLTWATRLRAELREPDQLSRFAIEGTLLLLVADLSRVPIPGEVRRPRWLSRVESAIEESLARAGAEPPSVSELAALAGVHASHLLRTFRRHHGSSVASFVRRRRIERARLAIAKGDRPLALIAVEAGFSDQSHFTRVFRRTFGETPGAYVRSLRRG